MTPAAAAECGRETEGAVLESGGVVSACPRPAPFRLVDVIRVHARTLAAAGIDRPEADAFGLARHALGLSPAALRTVATGAVAPGRLDELARLVARRALRVPLQHLTGETGFRRLTLTCRPGVFIPRPETEVLAEAAVDRARDAVAELGRAVLIEPCTGSGAVALAVAHEVAGARVIATDLDPAAVALARENLARLRATGGLAPRATCDVLAGDLLDPVPAELRGEVDVIVANPPYLTPAEVAACPPEVRDHDPPVALVGGHDGHTTTDRLLSVAEDWLRPGGWLLLEVAETRAAEVSARARRAGYDDVAVAVDLVGRPRLVAGRMVSPRSS